MASLSSISKHVQESAVKQDIEKTLPATELETIQETKHSPANGKRSGDAEETILADGGISITKESAGTYKKSKARKARSAEEMQRHKKPGIRRNCNSDPGLSNRENEFTFDNSVFEHDIDPYSLRFADVVSMLIQDQIKEDTHPYGRGNLYRSPLDGGRKISVYHEDGKLFVWLIVTLLILGIVGAAILMSIMYQPENAAYGEAANTTTSSLA